MLFLNTPGFEWRKDGEGNYDILLAGINEENLPKEVFVSKAIDSSIKDFRGNEIYKMICDTRINLTDEFIVFVTNEEKVVVYAASLYGDEEKDEYIEVRRYSDISSSNKYIVFKYISLCDDNVDKEEDIKRDSLTLEDLLGQAYKDTKLSMIVCEMKSYDISLSNILMMDGQYYNSFSVVGIDHILPTRYSVEDILKNPKLIRNEEFKFIFGNKYIILPYEYLISSLYKTLLQYKNFISDLDNTVLLATEVPVRYS